MSDVGDAIELTYTTTPGATVTVTWTNTADGTIWMQDAVVDETTPGQYPITLVGPAAGTFRATFTSTGTAVATEEFYERFTAPDPVPPLATVGEYTEIYGNLSAARTATARALLRRASRLVRDTYRGIDARIAAGAVAADSVGLAVLNMVARVLRNPGGLRSETTGPFSRAYDIEAASGMLLITEADGELLSPPDPTAGGRGKMGTIRVSGGLVPPNRRPNWRLPPSRGFW